MAGSTPLSGRLKQARAVVLVAVAAVLVALGLLASSAVAKSSAERSLTALSREVFVAINAFRTSHGLVALRESNGLDKAALAHSLGMGARGYFAHHSADGEPFWLRLRRYYRAQGYASWAVGENLLWHASTVSAARALQMWIASPPHLEILEAAKWRDLGVSAVRVANAGGAFGGQTVTIVTADFGVRSG